MSSSSSTAKPRKKSTSAAAPKQQQKTPVTMHHPSKKTKHPVDIREIQAVMRQVRRITAAADSINEDSGVGLTSSSSASSDNEMIKNSQKVEVKPNPNIKTDLTSLTKAFETASLRENETINLDTWLKNLSKQVTRFFFKSESKKWIKKLKNTLDGPKKGKHEPAYKQIVLSQELHAQIPGS